MPSVEVMIDDMLQDFAGQMDWVRQARIENVHSVAQLDQCLSATAALREVLEGAMKWDFLRSEVEAPAKDLSEVEGKIVLMRKQANACIVYMDTIEQKTSGLNPETATEQDVEMLRSFFVQTLQETKQEYDLCMEMGKQVESDCREIDGEIQLFTKNAVVRAVTLNHDETLEIIEWIESGSQIVLSIAEVANPEPISAYATTGIRWLIKAVSTLAREITVAVRQRQRTLADALTELQPLDIAKGKVKDAKLAIGWALEPLTLIKSFGSIIKGAIMVGVNIVLDAPITAAEAKLEEAKKQALGKTEEESLAKQILEDFGSNLKDSLTDTVKETLEGAAGQISELVKDGKTPAEFIASISGWILQSLLEPVLAKIVDPAQAVTATDIASFAENLTSSYSTVLESEYLKPEDVEKLGNIGEGTEELVFDESGVDELNTKFLKEMAQGDERSVFVGQSPVLASRVALLVNAGQHRAPDQNYVLSLIGNAIGTVKMVSKATTFSAGELEFTDVPADLVKQYFEYTKITRKKLKFK